MRVTIQPTLPMILALAVVAVSVGPGAARDHDFGMPADVAQRSRQYCSTISPSLTLRATCMQMERDAYAKMGGATEAGVTYFDSAEEGRKIKAGGGIGFRDPPGSTVDLCPPPHYVMTARDGCQPAGRRDR